MSCTVSCAQPTDFTRGWTFFGPAHDPDTYTSHQFEVRDTPVILTADGLTDGHCVSVEQVFGCGVGDAFVPLLVGCGDPVNLTQCWNSVVVTRSGRYRLVITNNTGPVDPTSVTIYGRAQLIAPGYDQESNMACGGCTTGATNVTLVSADGVTAVGTAPNYVLDFNPVVAAAELAGSAPAVALLCGALTPCISALIPAPVPAVTLTSADGVVAVGTAPNYALDFNPVLAVNEIAASPTAVAALCTALTPCISALVPPPVPAVTLTSADGVIAVGTAPNYALDFNPVLAVNEIAGSAGALAALCTALTPCISALVPPAVPAVTLTSADGVTTVGTAPNYALEFNPATAANEIAASPAAVSALCTALAPCISALIPAAHNPAVVLSSDGLIDIATSGADNQTITLTVDLASLCTALTPCINALIPPDGGVNITSPNGTITVGGSTTAPTLDVNPVGTAAAIAGSAPAVAILCTALAACINAALNQLSLRATYDANGVLIGLSDDGVTNFQQVYITPAQTGQYGVVQLATAAEYPQPANDTDAATPAYVNAALGAKNDAILFQDEGAVLGVAGTVDTINFVGAGVTATRAGDVVTVTVPGALANVVPGFRLNAPVAPLATGVVTQVNNFVPADMASAGTGTAGASGFVVGSGQGGLWDIKFYAYLYGTADASQIWAGVTVNGGAYTISGGDVQNQGFANIGRHCVASAVVRCAPGAIIGGVVYYATNGTAFNYSGNVSGHYIGP